MVNTMRSILAMILLLSVMLASVVSIQRSTSNTSFTDRLKLRVAVYTSKSSLGLDEKLLRLVLGSNRTFTVRSNQTSIERKTRINVDVEFHLLSYDFEITRSMLSNVGHVRDLISEIRPSFIIGPFNSVVKLVADDMQKPYLMTSHHTYTSNIWDPTPEKNATDKFNFRMIPSDDDMATLVCDVVLRMRWEDVAILYNNGRGLDLVGHVMELSVSSVRAWKVSSYTSDRDIRDRLLQVRQLNLRSVIVACNDQVLIDRIFSIALRLSMLSNSYSWLIADMNPFLMSYDDYNETMVNLTTFKLFESVSLPTSDADSTTVRLNTGRTLAPPIVEQTNLLELAVITDVVSIIRSTVETWLRMAEAGNSSCSSYCADRDIPSSESAEIVDVPGLELSNIIRRSANVGLTGSLLFDNYGNRLNSTAYVMSMTANGFKQDPPFVMRRSGQHTGNTQFEGFLIDLIDVIATELKFQYELYEVPDGNYGGLTSSGEWNGMVNELIIGNASMCLGAISITSLRESVIDFSKPFKQKKFNLLMRKPEARTSIFQFLWPFSASVWFLMLSGIVIVSILLTLIDRISPNGRRPDDRFGISESLFFVYGTLVGPGTDTFPTRVSGRILAASWWFVGLILVSSYTANLAAFLTVTKIDTPIKTVADLAAQRNIKYGTVKNTYAASMFSKSQLPLFQKMWQFMDALNPDSMVDNTTEGIRKVRAGDYAFIWDEPINKYIALNECDLMAAGESFDEKGYGIGVPIGADYRDDLTMAILSLGERGEIKRLEDRWWTQGECDEFKETTTSTEELDLLNVAGVFLVLVIGVVLAAIVCLIEYLTTTFRHRKKQDHLDDFALRMNLPVDRSTMNFVPPADN